MPALHRHILCYPLQNLTRCCEYPDLVAKGFRCKCARHDSSIDKSLPSESPRSTPTSQPIPQQTCHAALLTDDILRLVFEQFLTPGHKKLLHAAASTCVAWSQVALDLSWRDVSCWRLLNVLAPVERLVPSPFSGRGVTNISFLEFLRPLSVTDWERFGSVACKVRRLRLEDPIGDSIIQQLTSSPQGPSVASLLSGLTHLSLTFSVWEPTKPFNICSLFLPSTLRTFDIRGQKWESVAEVSISSLAESIQVHGARHDLTSLHLDLHLASIAYDTLKVMVTTFSGLRELHVRDLADLQPLLQMLQVFERLRRLYLSGYHWSSPDISHKAATSFGSLTDVTIGCAYPAGLIPFLRDLRGREVSLRSFEIHGPYGRGYAGMKLPPGIGSRDIFDVLGSQVELKSIWIEIPARCGSFEDMAGMIHCHQLEDLMVNFGHGLHWADRDVEKLLRHLPKLKSICVYSRASTEEGFLPNTTLYVLEIITRHCPDIETIKLEVDAEKVPGQLPKQAGRALKGITLLKARVGEDTNRVAQYLAGLSKRRDLDLSYNGWVTEERNDDFRWSEIRDKMIYMQNLPAGEVKG